MTTLNRNKWREIHQDMENKKLTKTNISLIEEVIASALEKNCVPEILFGILYEIDSEGCQELVKHPVNRKENPDAPFSWEVSVKLRHHTKEEI